MKKQKLSISIVALLLIGVALLSATATKTLLNPKNLQPTPEYTYNNIALTGTPINNGEFIFGGGTYRDVNLKLKLKIPVGWSIGLGDSGNSLEEPFSTGAHLKIFSNNQQVPADGELTSSDLIERIRIDVTKYNRENAGGGIFNSYTSYEDAVAQFLKNRKSETNVVSVKDEEFLLAGKYKAHKFDVQLKDSVYVEGNESKNSPMRFKTVVYIYNDKRLYEIEAIDTNFYNSPQVQDMLNSIEFYE